MLRMIGRQTSERERRKPKNCVEGKRQLAAAVERREKAPSEAFELDDDDES
jgi:hypothetical protein